MGRTNRRRFLVNGAQLLTTWALGCGAAANERRDSPSGGSGGRGQGGEGEGGEGGAGLGRGGQAAGGGGNGGTASPGGAAGAAGQGGSVAEGGTGGAAAGDGGTHCQTTRTDIEGPFFTPESPERSVLVEPGMAGTLLTLSGRVVDASCRPIPTAVIDLWQADADGAYDTEGFRLRGHVRVDTAGRYQFETIIPGRYLNGSQFRPAHLHVKIYVGPDEVLTTQLYFEGDPFNAVDPWFDEQTMLRPVTTDEDHVQAEFDFVV